jgi:hypothetical protein
MRWRLTDLRDTPLPFQAFFGTIYVLAFVRSLVVYLLVLGFAVACLVVGTTTARYVGSILLVGCLLIALVLVRKRFANRDAKPS